MISEIKAQAQYWATSVVFDLETRKEISKLIQESDESELKERFYRNLEFGTGGLRGILGAGTSRMNIYNVRKASQAFADYLNAYFQDEAEKKIAISLTLGDSPGVRRSDCRSDGCQWD